MIAGVVIAVMAGSIAAEMQFEERIKRLPEDRRAHLREKRREWQQAMHQQAQDSARHSGAEADGWIAFLLGVALGAGIA